MIEASYLIPLAPLAGFLVAMAIGFGWQSYREFVAIRVRKGGR